MTMLVVLYCIPKQNHHGIHQIISSIVSHGSLLRLQTCNLTRFPKHFPTSHCWMRFFLILQKLREGAMLRSSGMSKQRAGYGCIQRLHMQCWLQWVGLGRCEGYPDRLGDDEVQNSDHPEVQNVQKTGGKHESLKGDYLGLLGVFFSHHLLM